jgi:hypothetical protein
VDRGAEGGHPAHSRFHITFTTDHATNGLFAANQKVLFDALFWASSQTLKKLAQQELQATTLDITAVLHTWGQKLDRHVHLHCLMSRGGLACYMGKGQGRNKSLVAGDHTAKTDHSEKLGDIEANIKKRLEPRHYLEYTLTK